MPSQPEPRRTTELSKTQTELPNIVMVVFDTARRDRFSCHDYNRPTTPTVDSLASSGLKLDNMVANAPYTLPSHASLFTGLYPSQHGSQWQTGPRLRDQVKVTMAEWFKSLGYETICATSNGLISDRTRLARGFDRYAARLDLEQGWRRTARRTKKVLFGGDSGGETINWWLRRQLREVKRPFFLFVNYLECHWSYAPPGKFEKRVGGPRFSYLEGLNYRVRTADSVGPWEAIARADERTLDIYSTLYDGELANVDAHLASLLDILEGAGHLEDGRSAVMVTSDHGEHLGEHGLADHHASLDDVLLRVPFVAWGPGVIPNVTKDELYEFVDVFPSLTNLLGRDMPVEEMAGRRTGIFDANGRQSKNGDYAFAEWRCWTPREQVRLARRNPSFDFTGLARDLVSVRDSRYKLVRSSGGTEELFDLEGDPDEENDVASVMPDVVARLGQQLGNAVASWADWEQEQSPLSEDDRVEIEKRLADLGYI
jgi:arylsulfatase A-like enzyme